MPIVRFPDPSTAHESGVLAQGGDLHPQSLLLAYRQGIFPWPMSSPEEGDLLLWFCPPERAILNFKKLHISRSLLKKWKLCHQEPVNDPFNPGNLPEKTRYFFSINHDFAKVIGLCAEVTRKDCEETTPEPEVVGDTFENPRTWITPTLMEAYLKMKALGFAHSFEVWQRSEKPELENSSHPATLVGGLYGVFIDGVFAGESMFHLASDASKLAVLFTMHYLNGRGLDWIDIQVLTPHMQALGAELVPRAEFLQKLRDTQSKTQSQQMLMLKP